MEALTLMDLKATLDPKGMPAKIVDSMATSGALTEDGLWKPTNAFGRNVTARTLSEPEGELRRANKGISPGKGSIGQVEDYVGYLEAMSLVDDKVIRSVKSGNKQATRLTYDALFAKGLAKQGRNLTLYGDRAVNGEAFNGMAAKRAAFDNLYTIDCSNSGQTKRTSIYVVAWDGDAGCHYLYPEETKAGITTEDFGKQIIADPDGGNRFLPSWITWFYYDLGFVVKDDRALIRLCNIDPDCVTEEYLTSLSMKLNQALRTVANTVDQSKVKMYMNQDCELLFDTMELTLKNFNINRDSLEKGGFVTHYHGVQMRRCDEIISAEAAVLTV